MNKKEHSTVYGWEWPKGLPYAPVMRGSPKYGAF